MAALCSARSMSLQGKISLGLQAITKKKPIVSLASENQVSRKFVQIQKDKISTGIENAFSTKESEGVLFYLPVTLDWIKQFVVTLALDCRASFRGIIKAADNLLDYGIPIGTIFNILNDAIQKAKIINRTQDLSNVKIAAPDELFQNNHPVLAGVDTASLYCYLLAEEQHRDGDTWAIHLWDLQKQNFNPDYLVADAGSGLRAGHKQALPATACHYDHFHMMQALVKARKHYRNLLKSTITQHLKMLGQMENTKHKNKISKVRTALMMAEKEENRAQYLCDMVVTLSGWLEHDIFNMAGMGPIVRYELFDFVLKEFEKLVSMDPYLHAVVTLLRNQKNELLAFIEVLDKKFSKLAETHGVSREIIWHICELQRYNHEGDAYAVYSLPLQLKLAERYDVLEEAIILAMNTTERTSSMVENLNSRIRPYLFLRKNIGKEYLELLRFYLNHSRFLRSEHKERVGKSPAELLTKKPHINWLELLGFKQFKRAN
jgi:hypothetical protein